MPDSAWIKMPFLQDFTDTINPATFEAHRWRSNSLYDPYYESGGEQPLGFDQWSTFYQRYCVYAVKWSFTVRFVSGAWGRVAVVPIASDGAFTTFDLAIQQPGAKVKIYQGLMDQASGDMLASNRNIVTLKGTTYIKNLHGRKIDQYDDGATTGANPTTGAYLHLLIENEDATVVGRTYQVYCRLKFYAKMFERIRLPAS